MSWWRSHAGSLPGSPPPVGEDRLHRAPGADERVAHGRLAPPDGVELLDERVLEVDVARDVRLGARVRHGVDRDLRRPGELPGSEEFGRGDDLLVRREDD